jgi:hypothetical protein
MGIWGNGVNGRCLVTDAPFAPKDRVGCREESEISPDRRRIIQVLRCACGIIPMRNLLCTECGFRNAELNTTISNQDHYNNIRVRQPISAVACGRTPTRRVSEGWQLAWNDDYCLLKHLASLAHASGWRRRPQEFAEIRGAPIMGLFNAAAFGMKSLDNLRKKESRQPSRWDVRRGRDSAIGFGDGFSASPIREQ